MIILTKFLMSILYVILFIKTTFGKLILEKYFNTLVVAIVVYILYFFY